MTVSSAFVFQENLRIGLSRQGEDPLYAVGVTIRSAFVFQERLRIQERLHKCLSRQGEDLI